MCQTDAICCYLTYNIKQNVPLDFAKLYCRATISEKQKNKILAMILAFGCYNDTSNDSDMYHHHHHHHRCGVIK